MMSQPGDVPCPANCSFSETDWAALARFWHPVATSDEVAASPFSTVLLDVRVVVYRSNGIATAALDICPHRGAQLSRGNMVGEELQCPYHGLRFDGSGRCTLIPAQGAEGRIPERMRLTAFPTEERFGIVWAKLSHDDAVPLPDWSVLEQDQLVAAPVPPETWDVTAARHAENFNDIAHLAFVHQSTFGDVPPKVPDYKLESSATGLRHHYCDLGNSRLFERHLRLGADAPAPTLIEDVKYDYRFTYPFASSLEVRAPDGRSSFIFDVIQPIAAKKSRVFKVIARNFDLDGPIEGAVAFEQAVNKEDREAIEPALPVLVPLDPRDEFHIKSDRWSIAYRRALSKFGLGVDVDRVVPD
jgi:vanillate O-demethylase monooxygenase subunit